MYVKSRVLTYFGLIYYKFQIMAPTYAKVPIVKYGKTCADPGTFVGGGGGGTRLETFFI